MDMSMMDQDPPAHLLGTPAFFPALVVYIRSLSNSSSLPLDQVIVKSILLCLIAGDKHLILRTPEEDIGLVVKLVAWHSFTEPAPTRHKAGSKELPRALILSGIEKSSAPVQHALSNVLSERSIALDEDAGGVWNLPAGFITIYVCSVNNSRRPAIEKSLLDKFSLSHNVFVSQSIRHAFHSLQFLSVQSFSQSSSFSYSTPGSPSIPYQIPLPQTQTPPYYSKPLPPVQPIRHLNTTNPPPVFTQEVFPESFIELLQRHCRKTYLAPELGLYLSDLFSAARHHPLVDGMLLTARARKDAEDLARAARVIGSDLTGMELLRPVDSEGDDTSDYYDAQSTQYMKTIDESSTTNLLRKDSTYGSFTRMSSMGQEADMEGEIVVLDVTEVDVARTMPRVVTHRMSVRDGPEEEVLASAVIGATFGRSLGGEDADGRGVAESFRKGYDGLTIKDVLVDILNKV
ncbi:hypothetical protein EST38_g7792 [Candolleomyces aberdarensis]|uniref:Uncharacterized protein n=1 Tax=Candolleomyces aberdarensis TaxID=2316362 RepID=A0A4V1Q3C0_9AGAR|nr:hypothetical protein EST38_g7792 [Candolleomyces aberdarensis]